MCIAKKAGKSLRADRSERHSDILEMICYELDVKPYYLDSFRYSIHTCNPTHKTDVQCKRQLNPANKELQLWGHYNHEILQSYAQRWHQQCVNTVANSNVWIETSWSSEILWFRKA